MLKWTIAQTAQRLVTRTLLSKAMRITVAGEEHVPPTGPYILAWNHLHIADGMLLWSSVPYPTVFLATAKFRNRNPLIHAYLLGTGAILVRDGAVDRQAVKRALAVLNSGHPIAIAPEGAVSRTGGLCAGQSGIASLVCHSGAKVIPVAISGQFEAHRKWRRFERPRVLVRYGAPIQYPSVVPSAVNLRHLTDRIMTDLAHLLPPEFRGIYREIHPAEDSLCE